MMCFAVLIRKSSFFGTLRLTGFPGKLFPLSDWGIFPSLFVQEVFDILLFFSSGTPMIRLLEHLKLYQRLVGASSFFCILVFSFCSSWCLFFPFVPNHWSESQFPSLHCWFPVYFPLFHLVCLHFFLHFATELNHFCERLDYQCFELCNR